MAAALGLLSLTQLQKLSQQQQQPQPQPTFYNYTAAGRAHNAATEEDDSWEVRAFVEDTTSVMGTTWPPRSYMCNFCRREFRSAQALGGHMNVHRRDRARLRQSTPQGSPSDNNNTNQPSPKLGSGSIMRSAPVLLPSYSGEFVANGGLCLFYPMPGQTGSGFEQAGMDAGAGMLKGKERGTSEEGGEVDLELRLGWGY